VTLNQQLKGNCLWANQYAIQLVQVYYKQSNEKLLTCLINLHELNSKSFFFLIGSANYS